MTQVYFAQSVLFFVLFGIVAILSSGVRKTAGPGKKLVGWAFLSSLSLIILSSGLEALAAVLRECNTIETTSYLDFFVATAVFWYLAFWLLLFVFLYTLNTMLREQLGNVKAVFKFIYLGILGVMFALTAGVIGLSCYNIWYQGQDNYSYYYSSNSLIVPTQQLRVAYGVLYFLSVLAASALALMTVFQLRSRQHPTGDLIGWMFALVFAMVFWVILQLVFYAIALESNYLAFATAAALSYLQSFAQLLVFVFLLGIAKHAGWSKSAAAPTEVYTNAPEVVYQQPVQQPPVYAQNNIAPQQQQYAYNYPNGQQPVYNQQAPVYYGQPGQQQVK